MQQYCIFVLIFGGSMTSRMIREENKGVTILTGYLGAGKTTFLNALIKHFEGKRFAIIENEIGKEGLDGDLILAPEEGIFELNNGCLCCSLNEDLIGLLDKIHLQSHLFDELLIETTGIADPAGVAAPFYQIPEMEQKYSISRVICIIDAELLEDQLREGPEIYQQISFSDVIFINKMDLVSQAYLGNIKNILQNLNPMAKIFFGNKEVLPLEAMWNHSRENFKIPEIKHPEGFKHGKIKAISFRFDQPFDIEMMQNVLLVYLMFNSTKIFRIKGVISAHGYDTKIVAQSVRASLSLHAAAEWPRAEKRETFITIIGKDISREELDEVLKKCLKDPVNV